MNTKRLLKLADHLESGKLGHKRFNFAQLNDTNEPKCGSAGCALGECPIVFPEHWQWRTGGIPGLRRGRDTWNTFAGAMAFFRVSQSAVYHLFSPRDQRPLDFGGISLSDKATRKQVAANIRSFVDKMKEGK